MNILESKCAVMAQTPQTKWFDLRFKPVVQLLQNMNDRGEISLKNIISPIFKMVNMHTIGFKYDGEYYVLFYNQVGKVFDHFHLERTNLHSPYSNIMSFHIVLSSDDDPHQETYFTLLALAMGARSNSGLTNKLKAQIG